MGIIYITNVYFWQFPYISNVFFFAEIRGVRETGSSIGHTVCSLFGSPGKGSAKRII